MTAASSVLPALVGLAIAVFIIVRQFTPRRLTLGWLVLVPTALGLYGLTALGPLTQTALLLLGINSGLAAGMGALRGGTMRLWLGPEGDMYTRGTLLTMLFWLLTIGFRLGVYALERSTGALTLGSGTELMIPVAVTLGVQNLVVYLRGQRLDLAAA
jgi:hypothetical protein